MKISKSETNKSLLNFFQKNLFRCLKKISFSILNKKRREINYIKRVYEKRVKAEIEFYKDTEDEDKRDIIQAKDVLMLNMIYI